MEKLTQLNSDYFTLDELVKSATAVKHGISNIPEEQHVNNLQYGCTFVLDPLRRLYGKPIIVTSAFRCEELNKIVGGVKNSWHKIGCAADLRVYDEDDAIVKFNLLKKITYVDTVLFEHAKNSSWLHVQWNPNNPPRHHYNFNYYAK